MDSGRSGIIIDSLPVVSRKIERALLVLDDGGRRLVNGGEIGQCPVRLRCIRDTTSWTRRSWPFETDIIRDLSAWCMEAARIKTATILHADAGRRVHNTVRYSRCCNVEPGICCKDRGAILVSWRCICRFHTLTIRSKSRLYRL